MCWWVFLVWLWVWTRFGAQSRARCPRLRTQRVGQAVPFDLACNPGGPRGFTDVIWEVSSLFNSAFSVHVLTLLYSHLIWVWLWLYYAWIYTNILCVMCRWCRCRWRWWSCIAWLYAIWIAMDLKYGFRHAFTQMANCRLRNL